MKKILLLITFLFVLSACAVKHVDLQTPLTIPEPPEDQRALITVKSQDDVGNTYITVICIHIDIERHPTRWMLHILP